MKLGFLVTACYSNPWTVPKNGNGYRISAGTTANYDN